MRISKQEKELLRQAFSVPAPKKKRAFLRTLPRQEVGLGTLMLSQAAYIRKWVWAMSLLLFGLVVLMAQYVELDLDIVSHYAFCGITPYNGVCKIVRLLHDRVGNGLKIFFTDYFTGKNGDAGSCAVCWISSDCSSSRDVTAQKWCLPVGAIFIDGIVRACHSTADTWKRRSVCVWQYQCFCLCSGTNVEAFCADALCAGKPDVMGVCSSIVACRFCEGI